MSIAALSRDAPYRIETDRGLSVVWFLPEVGMSRWTDLEQVSGDILRQLRLETSLAFVVDLSSLTAMGSALVALIIKLWKGAKQHQRRMVVVNSNRLVSEVLQISGLADVWTIVPTRDDAIRALGNVAEPTTDSSDVQLISTFGWLGLSGAIIGLMNPPAAGSALLSGPLLMQWCCAVIAVLAGVVAFRRGQRVWQAAGLLQLIAALGVALTGLWQAI